MQEQLRSIKSFSPQSIDQYLVSAGYHGQNCARRSISVLAYRHIRRLKRIYLEGYYPHCLFPRNNYLYLGPSGSGKTFLLETMFKKILQIPVVIQDATELSETAYVGSDSNVMLTRLYENAGENLSWASCGIVIIDEFDKLAGSSSNARFGGLGTTKDVSGYGVQRSLLNLLSGKTGTFPLDNGFSSRGKTLEMPLHNLIFVGCGAFSGLDNSFFHCKNNPTIGFNANNAGSDNGCHVNHRNDFLDNTTPFVKYGFLPELIGRFTRVVFFEPLSVDVLKDILLKNLLVQYEEEFGEEGLRLIIDDDVVDFVVQNAIRKNLGARGLVSSLSPFLEEAGFRYFGDRRHKNVRLVLNDGDIVVE